MALLDTIATEGEKKDIQDVLEIKDRIAEGYLDI